MAWRRLLCLSGWSRESPILQFLPALPIRLHAGLRKALCVGLQYADRLPIGLESVIRYVPAETVKAFYDRWSAPTFSLWPRADLAVQQNMTRHTSLPAACPGLCTVAYEHANVVRGLTQTIHDSTHNALQHP